MPRRRGARRLAAITVLLTVAAACWGLWHVSGYHAYVIHTGSMEPDFMPGDLVLDRKPQGRLHPGEIITFRHSDLTTDVVTHRITAITPAGLIHTKGDANATADVWEIRPDQVVGVQVTRIKDAGFLAVFLQQPAGIGALAAGVLTLALLWRFFFPLEEELEDETEQPAAPRRRPLPGPATA